MVCRRTGGCTKAAGHQGFCSGHKGFKKRDGTPADNIGSSSGSMRHHHHHHHHHHQRVSDGDYEYHDEYEGGGAWDSEEEEDFYSPPALKRQRVNSGGSTPRAGDPLLSLLQLLDC